MPTHNNVEESFRKLGEEEREIISELDPNNAMLIIVNGPGKGARFLLEKDLHKVGRDVNSDIFLDDATVSRAHCLISRMEIGEGKSIFTLTDRESLNGSYLNGERISESVLHNGDEIHVGKYRLTFFTKS
jgi:pSer/pThr/pTyr-binding forkhead associated (FHA) protein